MKTERELEQAINQYGDMIRRICFLHVHQQCDVDDVFQNVFLKYMKKEVIFNDQEHEKAWFIRVTINCCKDYMKSWFKRKVDLTNDFSQFNIVETTEDGRLLKAVLGLPKKYRDIIYLHYYEGYSMRSIADIMNKSENTIYTWHHRAKDLLRKELGGDYFV